jgi:hypothetical protein
VTFSDKILSYLSYVEQEKSLYYCKKPQPAGLDGEEDEITDRIFKFDFDETADPETFEVSFGIFIVFMSANYRNSLKQR